MADRDPVQVAKTDCYQNSSPFPISCGSGLQPRQFPESSEFSPLAIWEIAKVFVFELLPVGAEAPTHMSSFILKIFSKQTEEQLRQLFCDALIAYVN
jgi:hypothetical protein